MATPTVVMVSPRAPVPDAPAGAGAKVYDRSSFGGDFLVTIPNQTAEDFERDAPENQFCEYFAGTIYMPSPVSDRHQELTRFFLVLLDLFCGERCPGQVLMGPAVLRLGEEYKPEPDVFVRRAEPGGEPKAVLVLEVLSPSNRGYDLDFKSAFYRNAGIPEVWYVDDRDKVFFVDRRADDGYRRERLTGGRIVSTSLPGFWIDMDWLWSDPLPNRLRCLETILAGPPPA